jgi:hypothetical protein
MKTTSLRSSTDQGTYADYQAGQQACIGKKFTFVSVKRNEKPSMLTGADERGEGGQPLYYPPLEKIPSSDIIFDERKRMRRAIRYIPGETTIYHDEMSDIAKENKHDYKIKFERGVRIVSGDEWTLLDYMFKSNWNVNNPHKITEKPGGYYLFDKEAVFREAIDKDTVREEAKAWCHNALPNDIIRFSRALKGTSWVVGKSVQQLRWELLTEAMLDPARFMNNRKDERLIRKGIALDAIDMDILVVDKQNNRMKWGNTGREIVIAPMGTDPLDYMIEASFTEQGSGLMAEISRQLMPNPEKIAPPVSSTEEPQISFTGIDNITAEAMFNEFHEQGVIEKIGPSWWKYNDKKYRKKELMDAMQSDSNLVALMQKQAEGA